MMGVTHIFIGTMSSVILTAPESPGGCLVALVGGAVGGIVCDIDLGSCKRRTDVSQAGQLAAGIALACLTADRLLTIELSRSIRGRTPQEIAAGLTSLATLYLWGRRQPHRGGTHSLAAAAAFGMCIHLVCGSMLAEPFLIAMLSHLVLDLLNCRPVRLLYPMRPGFCLRFCGVDGLSDRLLCTVGFWGTILGIGMYVVRGR